MPFTPAQRLVHCSSPIGGGLNPALTSPRSPLSRKALEAS
jgi:hypothetical protein